MRVFEPLSFDRNHFVCQLTKYFAMNTLHKNIKISVLISMIAIGATLAGCASRSSKTSTASTGSTSSTSASTGSAAQSDSSPAAAASSSSVLPGATITGNAGGQGIIAYDELMGLIRAGAMRNGTTGQ